MAIVALASSLGTNLQTLIMKSLTHVGDAGMTALGQNCPLLTVLDITKTGATDIGIAAIAAGCNNLIRNPSCISSHFHISLTSIHRIGFTRSKSW